MSKRNNKDKINDTPQGILLDDYDIIKRIGSGSFGEVYFAKVLPSNSINQNLNTSDRDNHKKYVAIKTERKEKKKISRVYNEYKIYKYLRRHGFKTGIAKLYDYIEIPDYNMLVMELLGPSLEEMFDKCNRRFTLPTIYLIAIQLIDLIRFLHELSFIHRDIKPNNFSLGYYNYDQLHMLDFGLSKKYYYKNTGHLPYRSDKSLVGTVRYVSKNIHRKIEPTRRDDLESIGYMLVYFAKGKLPWQGLHKLDGDRNENIGKIKMETSVNTLCSKLPKCFHDYLNYCYNLKFDERPDYDYLINLFERSSKELKFEPSFEWSK